MGDRAQYAPGSACGAEIRKNGEKWTLILVRQIHHAPQKVWSALTDPAQLREWAPFEADGDLGRVGAVVNLTWAGTSRVTEAKVTCADAPRVLEFQDLRWELEPVGNGTRLTLWHCIDGRYITWGAAGWHICFDMLALLLADEPMGRLAGSEAMKLEGWQRLTAEYATLFGAEAKNNQQQAEE